MMKKIEKIDFVIWITVMLLMIAVIVSSGCTSTTPNYTADSCGRDAVWTCRTIGAVKECACMDKQLVQDQLDWNN